IVNAVIIGWDGRRPRWLWWALAAIAAVPVLLFPTHLPMRARWAASEWAFDHIVSTLPSRADVTWQSPRSVSVPAHVGLYTVSRLDIVPAGYVFHDPDGGDLGDTGDAGFIYLPEGPSVVPVEEGYVLVPLHAAWYPYWQAS